MTYIYPAVASYKVVKMYSVCCLQFTGLPISLHIHLDHVHSGEALVKTLEYTHGLVVTLWIYCTMEENTDGWIYIRHDYTEYTESSRGKQSVVW